MSSSRSQLEDHAVAWPVRLEADRAIERFVEAATTLV